MLEVGSIGRAHGLKGDVVVHLVTNRLERVAPGAVLETAKGSLVVETSRPQQGFFVVHFQGVDTREAAETLNGVVLSAEPLDDPDALWAHELVGSFAFDVDRAREIGKSLQLDVPMFVGKALEVTLRSAEGGRS